MSNLAANYNPTLNAQTVAFASSLTSAAIDTRGGTALAIYFPTGWVTADVTFSAKNPLDATFSSAIKDSNGTLTITGIVANDWLKLPADFFVGIQSFKIISTLSQTVSPVVIFGPITSTSNIS